MRVEAVCYVRVFTHAGAVAFGGAVTLEELLRRAYGVAMTPLPASALPDVDPAAIRARLGAMLPGPVDVSGLPQMPAAWAEYARQRGLYPEQNAQRGGLLEQLQAGQR